MTTQSAKTPKHTPGPWKAYCNQDGFAIKAGKEIIIGDYFGHKMADYKLAALAPELLEALQGLLTGSESEPMPTKKQLKQARAILKKAGKA